MGLGEKADEVDQVVAHVGYLNESGLLGFGAVRLGENVLGHGNSRADVNA
jgi:hypothetical protein